MPILRAGIMGCGRMGKIRAQSILNCGGDLAAVFDPFGQRLDEFSNLYPQCSVQNSLDSFPWTEIDVLFICSPPINHISHILLAVKNEKPFLIEKPLSNNFDGVEEALAATTEANLMNAVGYMNRYRPSVQYIKSLSLLSLSAYWINKMYNVPWWSRVNESGGPLNEQATHFLDLFRHFMGNVSEVHAFSAHTNFPFPTTVAINFKFQSGHVGNILYSCDANSKNIGIECFTTTDKYALESWDLNLDKQDVPRLTQQEIFDLETRHFFNAILENNPQFILSDLSDALKTQLLADAINYSLEAKEVVNLSRFSKFRGINY